MAGSQQCRGEVTDNSLRFTRFHRCTRKGSIERDGKWFCKTHDPVTVAEKQKARKAKWDADYARDKRKWARRHADAEIVRVARAYFKQQASHEDLDRAVIARECLGDEP